MLLKIFGINLTLDNYQIINYRPEWNINIWFFFLKKKKKIIIVDIYKTKPIWDFIIKELENNFNLKNYELRDNILIFNNVNFKIIDKNILYYLRTYLNDLSLQHYFERINPYWDPVCFSYQLTTYSWHNEGFYVIEYLDGNFFSKKKKFKIIFYITKENKLIDKICIYQMYNYMKKFALKNNNWFLYTNNISWNEDVYSSILKRWDIRFWIKNLQYKSINFNEINEDNVDKLLYPKFIFFIEEYNDFLIKIV